MTPLCKIIEDRLIGEFNVPPAEATDGQRMAAIARLLRDELSARALRTQMRDRANRARRVHYLSMEFLVGRSLTNAIEALDLRSQILESLALRGRNIEQLQEAEADAGLGNGG